MNNQNEVARAHDPVSRPTSRGVYFFNPDGFLVEIRCEPISGAQW